MRFISETYVIKKNDLIDVFLRFDWIFMIDIFSKSYKVDHLDCPEHI